MIPEEPMILEFWVKFRHTTETCCESKGILSHNEMAFQIGVQDFTLTSHPDVQKTQTLSVPLNSQLPGIRPKFAGSEGQNTFRRR